MTLEQPARVTSLGAAWLLSTVATAVLSVLFDWMAWGDRARLGAALVTTFSINGLLWFPAILVLQRIRRPGFGMSVLVSLGAGFIGQAVLLALMVWLVSTKGPDPVLAAASGNGGTTYTDWTIGHVHYGQMLIRLTLLWTFNGALYAWLMRSSGGAEATKAGQR